MGIGKELSPSKVTVWLGQLNEKIDKTNASNRSKPQVPEFSWLKAKDTTRATVEDDDPTIQWGCMRGNTNFEASPTEDLREHIGSWIDVD